jgi:signal peptidase I
MSIDMTEAQGPAPDPAPGAAPGDRIARWLLLPLVVVLVATIFIFFVFFQPIRVSGPSMLPGLHDSDLLLITKGYSNPVRGDIVVFTEQERGQPIDVVKRVVGVPGDTVEMNGDVATVNGVPEPPHAIISGGAGPYEKAAVPPGTVYVLGDNRPVSLDSRYRGPIPLSQMRGRVVFRFAPITRIGFPR